MIRNTESATTPRRNRTLTARQAPTTGNVGRSSEIIAATENASTDCYAWNRTYASFFFMERTMRPLRRPSA